MMDPRMGHPREHLEGEGLYRSLFQSMLNGFAYCRMLYEDGRPDFIYLDVNEAFETHTGLKGVVGRKVSDVIPGIREQDPGLFEIYGRVARTGRPERFEMFVAALAMWFHISVYCPAPGDFVAVFDVITERKKAEEALRLSEEKFAKAFQRSPTMMSLTEVETGRYLDMNDAFLKHSGYAREELLGRTTTEVGWLEEASRQDLVRRIEQAGHLSDLTAEFRGKDGRRLTCLFSCERVQMGGETRILSTFQDITPLVRTEEALREAEGRYRSLFRDSPTGLWLDDFSALEPFLDALRATVEGPLEAYFEANAGRVAELAGLVRVVEINQAGLRMFDLDEARELPTTISPFLTPATLEVFGRALAVLARGGTAFRAELPRLDHKGRTKWFDLNLVVQPGHEGRLSRVLVGFVDITERKTAEEAKAKLSAQLLQAQKMESLGSLAGGVAHDMNNVLGAILALASANLQVHPPDSFTYHTFETIHQAAVRGGDLVKRLLTFARKNPIKEQEVDLNRLLREEVRLLERTTLAQVRLELDLEPEVRPILGDESALAHAFMNLCVNAVDAMPEGGTVTLRTRNVDPAGVEVLVEDTGTGMPREVLDRALDPYFTTKPDGKGTGLGLPLVYSTVQAHQGAMELESEPGRGTRVRLRFPSCGAGNRPLEAAAGNAPKPAHRAREVLLVDDDELIQRATGMLLAVLGHGCVIAASGEEALERVEAGFRPDLVILDVNMPGLGGAGTLPRLRALCPGVPILLATGRPDQAALDLAASSPHVALLAKPFTLEDLQAHLKG